MDQKLRSTRSAVALLKKSGLLPDRLDNGQKLDARSAYPNWRVGGKKLSTIIRKYDDVVSGKVTPLKVDPTKLKQYRKQGESTTQGKFVLVPHKQGEVAKLDKGNISVVNKSGITRVQLPIEFHSVPKYVSEVSKNQKQIDKMKRKSEYFGFRFYGNNSSEIYSSIDDLMQYFVKYNDVQGAGKSRTKGAEVIKNLEIVKIQRPKNWEFSGERQQTKDAERNREAQRKYRKNLKKKPLFIQLKKAAANSAKQKAYRERVKRDPKKYKAVKKAAAKRMRKHTKQQAVAKKKKK